MAQISAAEIAEARRTGRLLARATALSLDEGYAIAAQVAERLGAFAGWKVGATNAAGQAFLGIDEPIRGRVFRDALFHSPAHVSPPGDRPCEIEPEIVLEAGPDGRAVRAWIGLEIVRPSRDDALALGPGFIVADNAAHVGLVLGPEFALNLLDDPKAIRLTLARNGEASGGGSADAVLGDPRRSLEWLAQKGVLRPGELVATGAMCRAAPFAPGDAIRADFAVLGLVETHWPRTQ